MNHHAVLAHPIGQVFGHLADPARLGDWLPAATAIHTGHGAAGFTLRLSRDQAQAGAAGDLIGYEPPWQLAYRLRAGQDTHVLRITCTTTGAGTRVHVRQVGPAAPLAVDLARLGQALTGPPPARPPPALGKTAGPRCQPAPPAPVTGLPRYELADRPWQPNAALPPRSGPAPFPPPRRTLSPQPATLG